MKVLGKWKRGGGDFCEAGHIMRGSGVAQFWCIVAVVLLGAAVSVQAVTIDSATGIGAQSGNGTQDVGFALGTNGPQGTGKGLPASDSGGNGGMLVDSGKGAVSSGVGGIDTELLVSGSNGGGGLAGDSVYLNSPFSGAGAMGGGDYGGAGGEKLATESVPEPFTLYLVGLGVAAVGARVRGRIGRGGWAANRMREGQSPVEGCRKRRQPEKKQR